MVTLAQRLAVSIPSIISACYNKSQQSLSNYLVYSVLDKNQELAAFHA